MSREHPKIIGQTTFTNLDSDIKPLELKTLKKDNFVKVNNQKNLFKILIIVKYYK